MPIDWDKLDEQIDNAIDKAADKTNKRLADKISSISRLTDDEIMEFFPKPADVEKLKDLLKIVKSAETHNQKTTKLVGKIEDLSGTVITLLKMLV